MAAERIEFWKAEDLGGVRVLSVSRSRHLWTLFHEAYAFTLVKGGSGRWRYRRREREIQPRTMMLIEPGNVHVTTAVGSAADFDTLFVDGSVVAKASEHCGLPGGFPHLSRADSDAPPLLSAFERLLQTLRDPHGEALERAEAFERALYGLFRHACEVSPSTRPAGRAKLLRARDMLHDVSSAQNGMAALGMTALAGSVGLSPIQLIRGFKALYGLPPYQYLVRLRMTRALRLIEDGPTDDLRSLTDVALEAGFCDLAHMNKHFRRMIRMSPSTYAASMRVSQRWMKTSRRWQLPAF